jgi:hypothetical protein
MKIPDEAVEVGAAALCECDGGLWGDLGPEHRAPYISESYAVLSEALPHLRREWERQAVERVGQLRTTGWQRSQIRNEAVTDAIRAIQEGSNEDY